MLDDENLTVAPELIVTAAPTLPEFVVLTFAPKVTPPALVLLSVKAEVPPLPPNAVIEVPPTVWAALPLNSTRSLTFAPVETPPMVPLLVKLPPTCKVQFWVGPVHNTSRSRPLLRMVK